MLGQVLALTINETNFGPAKYTNIGSLVSVITPWLLIFGGLIFTGLVIYAGFILMNSAGDPKKLTEARELLKSGVIGIIIILSAITIISVVAWLTGAKEATTLFGN